MLQSLDHSSSTLPSETYGHSAAPTREAAERVRVVLLSGRRTAGLREAQHDVKPPGAVLRQCGTAAPSKLGCGYDDYSRSVFVLWSKKL